MKDRNEWFEEVERAYSKLKIVERPYAPPHAAVAVEAEDVLCCLGLHPHISASDWLVINLDEVSELIELIRPVPVTGAMSALHQGGRSGNPVCAYLAARGLCRGHMSEDGKCRLSDASFCANGMVSNIRGRIKRLCAGDGEKDRSEK